MSRPKFSLSPFVGYHGCDRSVANNVLAGKDHLKPSDNNYDWLGPGIYFWVDSPERGWDWAIQQSKIKGSKIKNPAVIGALIHPGHCLNLTDYGVGSELQVAYQLLKDMAGTTKTPLPVNDAVRDGISLRRSLDCAVIRTVHQLRADQNYPKYDTVYGVFEEGGELFPGSALKVKTHVQVAVLETDCIVGGYFRPHGYTW